MIRPLHPIDVPRYALFGGPGWSSRSYTLDSLLREPRPRLSVMDAARLSLVSQRKDACAWAVTRGSQVLGIAAARPRSGLGTWEVDQLLLGTDDDPAYLELLRKVCQGVARKGGEKVFIRLPGLDPLVDVARLCGFVPSDREHLYVGPQGPAPYERPSGLREKGQIDEFDLFRLYNASTPSETRLLVGVTFDQWRSSRNRSPRGCHEFVYERDGVIRGWVRISRRFGVGQLVSMLHPDADVDVDALIDYGLSRLSGANSVYCLVPKYQLYLRRLLKQKGYQDKSEYVTLVKSMVVPARTEERGQAVTISPT